MDIRDELDALRKRRRNVDYREAQRLLEAAGFVASAGKGDHIVYRHPLRNLVLVPRQPLLPAYVTAIINAIEEVLE